MAGMEDTFFEKTCPVRFRFLVDEFGCKPPKLSRDDWGVEFLYRNATTAVRLRLEPREKYVFTHLVRLARGKLPAYPIFVRPGRTVRWYPLEDVLALRAQGVSIRQGEFGVGFTDEDVDRVLAQQADAVRSQAADLLRGDFTLAPALEERIRRRAEEYAKE